MAGETTIKVGTCKACGGDVMGFRGAFESDYPKGPDKCAGCGEVPERGIEPPVEPEPPAEPTPVVPEPRRSRFR